MIAWSNSITALPAVINTWELNLLELVQPPNRVATKAIYFVATVGASKLMVSTIRSFSAYFRKKICNDKGLNTDRSTRSFGPFFNKELK